MKLVRKEFGINIFRQLKKYQTCPRSMTSRFFLTLEHFSASDISNESHIPCAPPFGARNSTGPSTVNRRYENVRGTKEHWRRAILGN